MFGIIDYFQRYDFQKKLERFTKNILLCKFNSDISVTNPIKYSERFFNTLNYRIRLNWFFKFYLDFFLRLFGLTIVFIFAKYSKPYKPLSNP